MGKKDKETLNRWLKAVDSHPRYELHILKFIFKESDRITAFLDDHNVPGYLFIPFGKLFFHINVPAGLRITELMIKDNRIND